MIIIMVIPVDNAACSLVATVNRSQHAAACCFSNKVKKTCHITFVVKETIEQKPFAKSLLGTVHREP